MKQRRACCREAIKTTGWLAPAAVLFVLPKCPACFAAYLALATGLGVSASVCLQMRSALFALCIAAIAVGVLRLSRAAVRRASAYVNNIAAPRFG